MFKQYIRPSSYHSHPSQLPHLYSTIQHFPSVNSPLSSATAIHSQQLFITSLQTQLTHSISSLKSKQLQHLHSLNTILSRSFATNTNNNDHNNNHNVNNTTNNNNTKPKTLKPSTPVFNNEPSFASALKNMFKTLIKREKTMIDGPKQVNGSKLTTDMQNRKHKTHNNSKLDVWLYTLYSSILTCWYVF